MPDHLSLYRRHVKNLRQVGSGPEHVGICPFPACNGKSEPKFYANAENGLFICHRCGRKGNAITFAKYFRERPEPYYDRTPNPRPIDHREIDQYHQDLLKRPEHWRAPWKHHVLELLMIGWDTISQKLIFPIFNSLGEVINLIVHRSHQIKGARVTLYPIHLLEEFDPAYIVICEGLVDCVSLLSTDIQAVTSTGGALSIPADISALRRFKKIYLCFDVDEAGDAGVDRWINRLRSESDKLC